MRTAICHRHPLVLLGLKHLLTTHTSCDVVHVSDHELPGNLENIDILVVEEEFLERGPARAVRTAGRHRPEIVPLSADAQPEEVLRRVSGRRTAPAPHAPAAGHDWVAPLSPREQEVLQFIASGMTHDQVARRVGISRHTVDTYVKRVRTKFGVGNKAELTRVALGLKLV
ncbi:response regulator transcription factor [Streptomyces sp. NPDC059781]|uniref:helix-turn-helix transcriptional regulator n=1 Tax=Streptomyces sp. NPDC059781 TaxID=3346943 RepID=UPI0036649AD4